MMNPKREYALKYQESEQKKRLQVGVRVRVTSYHTSLRGGTSPRGKHGTIAAIHATRNFPYEVALNDGQIEFFEWYHLEPLEGSGEPARGGKA